MRISITRPFTLDAVGERERMREEDYTSRGIELSLCRSQWPVDYDACEKGQGGEKYNNGLQTESNQSDTQRIQYLAAILHVCWGAENFFLFFCFQGLGMILLVEEV